MKPTHRIARRTFLRQSATAGALAPFLAHRTLRATPANSRLQHACIGVGGMGWVDLQEIQRHPRTRIVALCDVDAQALQRAAAALPEARTYSDWRELLDRESAHIDSINVTVPDHNHHAIALSAIRRGKHVYCQKPMCHDVAEVRDLTQAAVRHGVVTQLGTQMAAGIGDRTTVALLRAGAIGTIQRAYLCSNRPGAVENYRLPGPRPDASQPAPSHLNWDLWLGTAPERPFAPDIYHPVKWRAWQDFGTGWSGDIGCHVLDALWKGLELQAPLTVSAKVQESWQQSPARRADTWPQANHITWTFPATPASGGQPLTFEWFDGAFYPPAEIRSLLSPNLDEYPAESAMLIGSDGALLHTPGRSPILLPEDRFARHPRPRLEEGNHYHEFLDRCLDGGRTRSEFAVSGPMTETVLLGTVAIRLPGETLTWNSRDLECTGHPDANRLLRRTYRPGWSPT